jgi:hypothetical protein
MEVIRQRAGSNQVLGHALRAAVLLVVAAGPSFAAQEQPKLQVRATSPRPDLLVCEPLVLDVQVKNVGEADAKLREMRPGDYGYSLNVRTPHGSTVFYKDVVESIRGQVRTITLAPGETYRRREVIVCFSSLSYVIGDVGPYSVEVSFSPDGRPESAVQAALLVVVREPQGLDAEGFGLFEGRRQALFMAGRTDERSMGEFQLLARDHPRTVYGRYARYYLAKALVAPRPQYAKSPYAKAAVLLEGLVSEEQGFPLTDQCMLDLAECYEQTNRKEEAKAILGKLIERFPESPVVAPAKKKLDSLQPPTPTPQVPQGVDAKPEPAAAPQPQPDQPPAPVE